MEVYNHFNFRVLYALIVDFFEGPSGQAARRRSQNLLKWWSTYVVGFEYMLNLTDQFTYEQTDLPSP